MHWQLLANFLKKWLTAFIEIIPEVFLKVSQPPLENVSSIPPWIPPKILTEITPENLLRPPIGIRATSPDEGLFLKSHQSFLHLAVPA